MLQCTAHAFLQLHLTCRRRLVTLVRAESELGCWHPAVAAGGDSGLLPRHISCILSAAAYHCSCRANRDGAEAKCARAPSAAD